MSDFITWCNNNQGFLSGLLTILALLLSTIAIFITIRNSKRQERIQRANINISLLDRRIEIYDYFLDVIYNIEDEMLRIIRSYYKYSGKEKIDFIFLENIDYCTYPLYFNNEVCLKPGYVMQLRIAKSIFGNEFEKVINEYIDRAVMFANAKVTFDKFIDEHGIEKLKNKIPFMFQADEKKNNETETKIVDEETLELLEKAPKLSAIAESYIPFLVCDRKFEKFIEKYLDINFV